LPLPKEGPVLFVGSGPNRVSQEVRGNAFAHSCLAYLREKSIPFVVMDNDAAGPLAWEGGCSGIIRAPFDAKGVSESLDSVSPARVWPVCAGKEVQALFLQALTERSQAGRLPGGPNPYRAATDWAAFRNLASSVGVEVPFGRVVTSIEGAAQVAAEVGFPLFLSASRSTGGGGARIVYNYEELTSTVGTLLTWSLGYEVLAVRVHEKHAQCEVHVMRDARGDTQVVGISDTLAPLGVHVANTTNVYPARSLSPALEKAVKAAATALAERAGLVGYAAFHFGLGDSKAYAVGMRAGFTASSYILSLGLGVDIARAATAIAFGDGLAGALPKLPRRPLTVVGIPRFENRLFPGAGEGVGPYKISTGTGIGIASEFAQAFLTAAAAARPTRGDLFESAAQTAREGNVLPLLAAPHVDLIADLPAAMLKGHSLEEIGTVSGINMTYLEELAALATAWQEVQSAGVDKAEPGRGQRKGRAKSRTTAKDVIRRGDRSGKALVVFGPPARGVGETDESDVMLRAFCRTYLARGYRLVFASWRSQMPLDLFFAASEIFLGDPGETISPALKSKGAALAYVDPRNVNAEEIAKAVTAAGVALAGVEPDKAAIVYDRKTMAGVLARAGLTLKEGEEVSSVDQARRAAAVYGYPILLKDRKGEPRTIVAYNQEQLDAFVSNAKGKVLAERFLEDLVESAAVVVSDGRAASTAAVVEILEEPGISNIDRSGVLPPFSIPERARDMLAIKAESVVTALGLKGLVTVRLGLRYDVPYFLTATLGACREAPFAAFATGRDILSAAAAVFDGAKLEEVWQDATGETGTICIRQPVFSFGRFPGADTILTTRPRSTGDVIGEGPNFTLAFAEARRSSGRPLPLGGTAFVSLRDRDKRSALLLGRQLTDLGFKIVATEGTARAFGSSGIDARVVYRVSEGRPNAIDLIKNREITLVIYTPSGTAPREDEVHIRTVAWSLGIAVITTVGEAFAAVAAIEALKKSRL